MRGANPPDNSQPSIVNAQGMIPPMLIAQALVERGLLDAMVANIWSALMQIDYYVGDGNSKWVLAGLAVVMAFVFFKPRR